ncbi:MAG: hypothetical protein AAF721_09340, partial [Myxococcota bacterium]
MVRAVCVARTRWVVWFGVFGACSSTPRTDAWAEVGGHMSGQSPDTGGTQGTPSVSGSTSGHGTTATGSPDGDQGQGASDGGATLDGGVFDVAGPGTDSGPHISDDECQKIDFLFVVDNSASMFDEQQALLSSYPQFISTIQQTVNAQDYHVMVVDTDDVSNGICTSLCE